MEAIPNDLASAALDARDRLARASQAAAAAGTSAERPPSQAIMAGAASAAIFGDALTTAMHARLEELKTVAK